MTNQKTILVVDDNEFVLELIERTLVDEFGYKVIRAENGTEALNKCKDCNFDLIITDIIMPQKDGVEFINELREINSCTPVIAISGGSEGGNADNFINFSSYFATETLTKPFSRTDLMNAVESLINTIMPDEALKYL